MKRYSVAVVGCGWIGLGAALDPLRIAPASHAQAAGTGRRTKLVALADTDAQSLALAKRLCPDVPRYTDVTAMLVTAHPEMVVIATNPESHCALIGLAARHGVRAILCEKPISHDVRAARAVIRECRKRKVLLAVNHMRRFDPHIRRIQDHLRGGYVRDTAIGPVRSAIAYYDKGLYHGGTHFIDLLRFFLGDVRSVSAMPNAAFPKPKHDVSVDALLEFDGATAALQYFDSTEYCLSEASFFGERGRLNLKHMSGLDIEVIGIRACDEYSSYRELNDDRVQRYAEPRSFLAPLLPHLVDCLEGRDELVSTGEDALRALEVIHALERSAEQHGQRVTLTYRPV